MIAARQIFLGRGGGAKLPYDAEVEWLASDGSSFVITNYIPSEIQRFRISYSASSYTKQCYFGCGSGTSIGLPTDTSWCALGASGNSDRRFNVRIRPDGTDWSFWCNSNYGNEYFDGTSIITVDVPIVPSRTQPNVAINDGTTTFVIANFGASSSVAMLPIAIFGRNSPSGVVLPAQSDFKFRELMFFGTNDETNLLAHFIPVRVGNDGATYDRVSKQLFRNQDTGAFLYGADKIPIETNRYVQDGLVAMWDGKENVGVGLHDANATVWKDLVGGVPMNNSRFGDDYAIPTGNTMTDSRPGYYPFYINGDFTLRGCLVNAPRAWYNWTEFGIGTGSGCENGIALTARDGSPNYHVAFRKSYSGTVECMAATGTMAGQKYLCDIVFHFAMKSYDVYVNGVLTGSATIPEGAWNLDNVGCSITYGCFQRFNGMGDFKMHNIMYYSRALTAAEIAANYAVDKARFNLP